MGNSKCSQREFFRDREDRTVEDRPPRLNWVFCLGFRRSRYLVRL